ncbi:Ig-like domain-containing protein [Myxococcus sp. Y35]|uniref:Ig-like domain-containing protein n=1 Tax=Pseudomyxococcus flavus TaxID=3115648 RepID=UPI003CF5CC71
MRMKAGLALAAAVSSLMMGCVEESSRDWAPEGLANKDDARVHGLSKATSRGREFWLAFPGNYQATAVLTLFIASDTATTGQVRVPGQGLSFDFSVTPGQVTAVALPSSVAQVAVDGVESKGIHVTAGADISVYGLNRLLQTTDAFLGLPTASLGTDYVVQAYPNVNVLNGSQFSVVATEDATEVTITPASVVGNHAAGVPFHVALNKGQAYQLRNTGAAPSDVSGTLVHATRPVAVFGGHQCANIPDGTTIACDYLVEQLPPTSTWGRRFVTVPLATRLGGDTFRFAAARDGTQVSLNGAVVAQLQRGQVFQTNIQGPASITANEPILVTQYSNGSGFDGIPSDPFMMLVPPFEQFAAQYTVTTPSSGFRSNFANIVVPNDVVAEVMLDGALIPASQFQAIGASGFSGVQLPVALGAHRLSAPQPFGVMLYGFDAYDSYGYPGGMALAPVAEVSTLTLSPREGVAVVGDLYCVTATVRDAADRPLAGVRVDFASSGVNSALASVNTTADGQAEFCFEGTAPGEDAVTASIGSVTDQVLVTWTKPNAPPIVDTGPDLEGMASQQLTLQGSASDPDGDPLTYAWSYVAPPGVHCTFGSPSAPVSSIQCDGAGTVTVSLTANDGTATATDSAQVVLGWASELTMCGLPRYTNGTSIKACGWATAGGSSTGIVSAYFTVDGGAPIPVMPDAGGGFVSTQLHLTEGTHVVRLSVVDALGHVTWREQTVSADFTPPVLVILSPTEQETNPDPVVSMVIQQQDASPATVVTQGIVMEDVPAGSNVLRHTVNLVHRDWSLVHVRATDAAGNTTEVVARVYVAP